MGFGQRAALLANATRTVGRTIISRTGSALRRFAVVVTAFVLGMGLMSIPEVPFVPEPPKADAQTGRTGDRSAATLMNDMGDCNFRQGDGQQHRGQSSCAGSICPRQTDQTLIGKTGSG